MEKDYKQEIQNTRIGSLGSSDASMLAQVANSGYVSETAARRLAVAKGIIPQTEIPHSDAVMAGDRIEMEIYNYLVNNDTRYESNPLWVSERYSKDGLRLIAHPDIVLQDNEKKTLFVYEVKTTKQMFEDARSKYNPQLYVEWSLAKEKALKLGSKWRVRLFLVVYSTQGIENLNEMEFETQRLTVKEISFRTPLFDIEKGMKITSAYVNNMTEYYEEELNEEYLPEAVKSKFMAVTNALKEINRRKKEIEDFKAKLCEFMQKNKIKTIRNESWKITLVNKSQSVGVDYKKLFEQEVESKKPRVAQKLREKYKKVTDKEAYVKITLNEE